MLVIIFMLMELRGMMMIRRWRRVMMMIRMMTRMMIRMMVMMMIRMMIRMGKMRALITIIQGTCETVTL